MQKLPLVLVVSILIGTFFALSASAGGSQEVAPQQTENGYKIVSAKDVTVKWKASGSDMVFEISAPTTGWISIGFDPSSVMKDADMVFGYVDGSTVVVRDQFGDGRFSHSSDEELGGTNDIVDYDGSESGGTTTLTFTIPQDSGDEYDKTLEPGTTHTVLIAYGPDGADNFDKKHKERGKFEITF